MIVEWAPFLVDVTDWFKLEAAAQTGNYQPPEFAVGVYRFINQFPRAFEALAVVRVVEIEVFMVGPI